MKEIVAVCILKYPTKHSFVEHLVPRATVFRGVVLKGWLNHNTAPLTTELMA